MAGASFSPGRNQVTRHVFASRFPPEEKWSLSHPKESILLFWFLLRTVSRWWALWPGAKQWDRLQAANLALYPSALRLESNRFQWSEDGKAIYFYKPGYLPAKVYHLDWARKNKTLWKELMKTEFSRSKPHWGPSLSRRTASHVYTAITAFCRPLSRGRIKVKGTLF